METFGNPFIFVKPLKELKSSQIFAEADGELLSSSSYDDNDYLHTGVLEFNNAFFNYPETVTQVKKARLLLYNTSPFTEKINLLLFTKPGDLLSTPPSAGNSFDFTGNFIAENFQDGKGLEVTFDFVNTRAYDYLQICEVEVNKTIAQNENSLQLYGVLVTNISNPFQFGTGGWVQVILDIEKC